MLDILYGYENRLGGRSGQSLIEVLIATVVGVVMIMAAISIIVPAMKGGTDGTKKQVSIALGKEMMDNVGVWAESDWHNISTLATSSSNKYLLRFGPSPFAVATGIDTVVQNSPTDSDLVGHWKLDEASDSVAYDFSGSNANGSVSGATPTSSKVGTGLNFPGSGSPGVTVLSTSSLNFGTGSFSVSLWGYFRSYTYPRAWFMIKKSGICYNSGYPGWDIGHGYSSDGIAICYSDGVNGSSNGSVAFDSGYRPSQLLNQWVHLVAVFDKSAGQVYFFVNGVRQTNSYDISSVTGSVDNSQPLVVGTMYGWQTDGILDDVRIYNRVLTETEIKELYKNNYFTRYFFLDDVNRDGSGNITTGAGSWDPSTKKLTVVYGWPGSTTSSVVSYLTRSSSQIFLQSDWSGGGGYTDPTSTVSNRFSSSTNINFTTSTGSIMINL